MWERLRDLSGGAKAGIVGGVVLLAAAGVGLGIWQPWRQPEDMDHPGTVQQGPQEPVEPVKKPEKGPTLRVEGEEIPCVVYEGAGWSIYVPEDWTTEQVGENGGRFSSGDGVQMTVAFENGGYDGSFINFSAAETGRSLLFYRGQSEGSPVVEGSTPGTKWDQYRKLLIEMARTLTVGTEKPFAESYVIPEEPDWQRADGMTVLFLDKDGYVVDEETQTAIEKYMLSWPEEDRLIYTGQYRINALDWASSYTGLHEDGYVDVFRADVQYRVHDGAAPEGMTLVDGWANMDGNVYLAVFHDGGSISGTKSVTTKLENGWIGFAGEVA